MTVIDYTTIARDAAERARKAAEAPSSLSTIWADKIELTVAPCGVIDEVLPSAGFGVLYGESGAGKTFAAVDMACHVAAGLPWRGKPVEKGVVVYVAAESPESVKRRLWAWKEHHGVKELPVLVVQSTVDLLNGSTDLLVELVKATANDHGRVAMVVIDTLARAMTGNENAPDDMGRFVNAGSVIREAGAAVVMVVHHTGKDTAKGARGHSCLRAASDFELEVTEGCIKVTKSRDEIGGTTFGFRLHGVELGENAKGRMVTTCVALEADPPAPEPAKAPPMGAVQKVLVRELRKLSHRHPEGVTDDLLKSAFIASLHSQREREGKPTLEPKRFTNKFNETLASALFAGHVDRLEDDLLRPGS